MQNKVSRLFASHRFNLNRRHDFLFWSGQVASISVSLRQKDKRMIINADDRPIALGESVVCLFVYLPVCPLVRLFNSIVSLPIGL